MQMLWQCPLEITPKASLPLVIFFWECLGIFCCLFELRLKLLHVHSQSALPKDTAHASQSVTSAHVAELQLHSTKSAKVIVRVRLQHQHKGSLGMRSSTAPLLPPESS